MRYVLFATAGHVDHGKTTLIKALTGIDTDRLPEEKKRGLSIDIGFAYLDFPEIDTRLELIDVPGHERFIKNAIAGLCSVSGVLLVVDAGEGVMPQTVEHLRVAKSFGVSRGVAVLTKIDRVEKDLVEIAEEELREYLKSEGLNLPVVRVSALTGEGLEELKKALREVIEDMKDKRREKPLRIFVDSAFTVKGHGTVLRGSCFEGEVKEGDKVVVETIGVLSRVRKIQNHGVFVKRAVAGERVALNLPEVDPEKVERGFWILKPGSYEKSRVLLIKTEGELKPGSVYQLFFGMREVRGRVRVVEEDLYLVRLEEDVVARRGDRLVILDSSGNLIGGGEVLHPKVRVTKKNFIRENAKELKDSFESYLLKERGSLGLTVELFRRLTGENPRVEILRSEGVEIKGVYYPKDLVVDMERKLRNYLDRELKDTFGVEKERVKEMFSLSDELLEYVLGRLRNYRFLNELIIDERRSDLTKNEDFQRLKSILEEGIKEEREILSEGVSKEILSLAVKRRHIHRIGEYLIISDELLRKYIDELRSLGDTFSVQEAKEKLGLTRKYLIPLLEYFDFLGLTVREGNERRWRR